MWLNRWLEIGGVLRVSVWSQCLFIKMKNSAMEIPAVLKWNTKEVEKWLVGHGMSKYATDFKENKITGEVLICADQELLKALNIKSAGDRIRLLMLVDELRKENELGPKKADSLESPDDSAGDSYFEDPKELKAVIENLRSRLKYYKDLAHTLKKSNLELKSQLNQMHHQSGANFQSKSRHAL